MLAYLVRKFACTGEHQSPSELRALPSAAKLPQHTSSIALSPPPMTASGRRLNMGAAPSHTAQAEMPLFQNPGLSPAPGNSSRFATAPVHTEQRLKCWCAEQRTNAGKRLRLAASGPRACGDDDRARRHLLLVCPNLEGPPRQVHLGDGLREDLGAKASALCPAPAKPLSSARWVLT